jgi:hypothetical protein
LGQRRHDFADFHIGDDLPAEMNAVTRDTDELVHIEPSCESSAVKVAQNRANGHDAVAAFDEGADVLVEERAYSKETVIVRLLAQCELRLKLARFTDNPEEFWQFSINVNRSAICAESQRRHRGGQILGRPKRMIFSPS